MTLVGGRSGATIQALKSGPRGEGGAVLRRLRAQYEWLQGRGDTLVQVDEWVDIGPALSGYTMELLEPLPWPPEDYGERTQAVIAALRPVWARPALRSPWGPGYHILRLPHGADLIRWWEEKFRGSLAHDAYCDTHGDPTLENVMRRPATGVLVLIDPVPDIVLDGKVPGTRALDLGKILQSGLGYEDVKLGRRDRWHAHGAVFSAVESACRGETEWELTRWCCAVHVAKFLPYQAPELRDAWAAWFPEILRFLREG